MRRPRASAHYAAATTATAGRLCCCGRRERMGHTARTWRVSFDIMLLPSACFGQCPRRRRGFHNVAIPSQVRATEIERLTSRRSCLPNWLVTCEEGLL